MEHIHTILDKLFRISCILIGAALIYKSVDVNGQYKIEEQYKAEMEEIKRKYSPLSEKDAQNLRALKEYSEYISSIRLTSIHMLNKVAEGDFNKYKFSSIDLESNPKPITITLSNEEFFILCGTRELYNALNRDRSSYDILFEVDIMNKCNGVRKRILKLKQSSL
jgi:hypothetical protein